MSELNITATTDKGAGPKATVKLDFPDTTRELITKYGEEAVYSRARASFVIDIQSMMRSAIKGEKKQNEIQKLVEEWKPGVKAKGRSTAEKAEDLLSKLTDEEKAALLAKFAQGKGAGKSARR